MAEPDNDVDDIPTNGSSNTFNDLDERFQLKPDMDPEYIFDEEKQMIAQLREKFPDLKPYSDKMLCWFLCARRHIMDDVVKLVDKFLAKRKEYNWSQTIPPFSDQTMQEFFKEKVSMHPHRSVDKHGRLVYYFFLGRNSPRSLDTMITFYMWECHFLCETESLANLRNGNLWVFDMDGFSLWKNVDMSSQGRSWASVMTGTFPFRIRGIVVLNAGFFTRALLGTAKLVLPAKLLKRISISSVNDLKALVPEEHLPTVYGGKHPCDFDKQLELMNSMDKKIVEDWKQALESVVKISPAPSPFPSRSTTPAPDAERLLLDDMVTGTKKLSVSGGHPTRSKTPPPESESSGMKLKVPDHGESEKGSKKKSPRSPRSSDK